jgi:hypothetical protein
MKARSRAKRSYASSGGRRGGSKALSRRLPLHFQTPDYDLPIVPANINCQGPPLTPLKRAWAFGEALRDAADAVPERVALVATGGISH